MFISGCAGVDWEEGKGRGEREAHGGDGPARGMRAWRFVRHGFVHVQAALLGG
jgi:hypothetical protein